MDCVASKPASPFYVPKPLPTKPRVEIVTELAQIRQRLGTVRLVPPLPKRRRIGVLVSETF
ncbi:MAG: hypothetical protein C5B53_10545 [Candidatus Melainabacteria bacterium]|nr:MAG: hypothetical protein C5B53_10545 [Candidatus Melainabacteria bacterium]